MTILNLNRAWRPVNSVNWQQYMPDARPQLTDLLPRTGGYDQHKTDWAGTCCVQAYSETMTAHLSLWYEARALKDPNLHHTKRALEVKLDAMIHLTAGHGVLDKYGSSVTNIGSLGAQRGIPLQKTVPFKPNHPMYATGTSVTRYDAFAIPTGTSASQEELEAAMVYREHLCACLDQGPVVVFLRVQPHYFWLGRPADEPYRRWEYTMSEMVQLGLCEEDIVGAGHCVSVYGYNCPTGDVTSLVLNYQENALKKDDQGNIAEGSLDPRHIMDPDAIEFYYVPSIDDLRFSSTPLTPVAKPKTLLEKLWADITKHIL